jgi:hypothetical protein
MPKDFSIFLYNFLLFQIILDWNLNMFTIHIISVDSSNLLF